MRKLFRYVFRNYAVRKNVPTYGGYPVDMVNDLSDGCTGIPEIDSPHKTVTN